MFNIVDNKFNNVINKYSWFIRYISIKMAYSWTQYKSQQCVFGK